MPSLMTVMRWRDAREEFRDQYARARLDRVDYWSEEITEIADDGSNDWMETQHGQQPDHEHINRSRLRVDTRKWLMSKMDAKNYGDKTQLTGAGGDGPVIIQLVNYGEGDADPENSS